VADVLKQKFTSASTFATRSINLSARSSSNLLTKDSTSKVCAGNTNTKSTSVCFAPKGS